MKFSVLITCRSKQRNQEIGRLLRELADRVERDELPVSANRNTVDYHIVRGQNGNEIGRAAFIAEPRLRRRLGEAH